MKYLVIAVLSVSTVFAIPSHYPYPIHPGVGAIYKGPHEETIIEGPDGSVITAESDSAGSIKLNSAPNVVDSAPAIQHHSPALINSDPRLIQNALNLANTGPNLFNSGSDEFTAGVGFSNTGVTYIDSGAGFVNAGDGLAHSGQVFVNAGDGLAHPGPAFINTDSGLAHPGPAFINAENGLAHSGQAFINTASGLIHSESSVANANANGVLVHSSTVLSNSRGGFVHSGPALINSGDGLVNQIPLVHSTPVLVNQSPGVVSVDHVAPAIINTAAPVLLHDNPIVVPDVIDHDPKIVEEHVLVGNKIISVPKQLGADSDLIGPSGTISTRGGDTVISGPASITIKGDGIVSEIDKQPDVHIKTVEVKPVVAPVVIKPVAPIATIEHTVVSNPIITEARPVLAPARALYAETAPILGINPIVKVVNGLNPILSHRPAIIKSGPILADSVATSYAEHNAVFGNPHYAPEFLPLKPFPFKPIYGPLH